MSIFLALIMMSVLLAMGFGISSILISQIKTLKGMENSLKAFCAADTGIEKVLYRDKLCRKLGCVDEGLWLCTTGCQGLEAGTVSESLGNADYTIEFDNGALNITSTGFYKETRRTIEVTRE